MTYLLITAEGVLHERGERPTLAVIDREVGPEGWATVRLGVLSTAMAWVNDCGLLAPERYPRNVIGSCVLAALGSSQQPYAGAVVVTGWDPDPWTDEPEIRPLDQRLAEHVRLVHRAVDDVLAGRDTDRPAGWVRDIVAFAEHIRTAPTPGITVLSGDEALKHLRRRAGA